MARIYALIFIVFFPFGLKADALNYKVRILGVKNKKILEHLQSSSEIVKLKKRPPATIQALRYRVDRDIPPLIQVMHSYGYYDAKITTDLQSNRGVVVVYFFIHPGQQYELETFDISRKYCPDEVLHKMPEISLEQIGIKLNEPAISTNVVNAENSLLHRLAEKGHPLAEIEKRKVFVNTRKKDVEVDLCVDPGPKSKFGPVVLLGLKNVNPKIISRKIDWKEGEEYDERKVEKTQSKLLKTELFSSVSISHENELDEKGRLPLKIRFTESKHQSFGAGVSYATIDGFGGTASWTHRNVGDLGQKLFAELSVLQREATGLMRYTIPDFIHPNQEYISEGEFSWENITVYRAQTYSLLNRIDQQVTKYLNISIGLSAEYITVSKSINDNKYTLLNLPIFVHYDHANDLLNATKGYRIIYQFTPSQAVTHEKNHFLKQVLTGNFYYTPTKKEFLTLAFRAQFSSLLGSGLRSIPINIVFLGGSDDELRGYRYKTVSPEVDGNPTGGRSAIYLTFEPRFRIMKQIGVVPFFDVGTVSKKTYPNVDEKWFKSIGIGLRYFTFFGPLRLDVAWPLDRRQRDKAYTAYISIGQTF